MTSESFPYSIAEEYLSEAGYVLESQGSKIKVNGGRATDLQSLFKKELDAVLTESCLENENTGYVMLKTSEKSTWIHGFAKYLHAKYEDSKPDISNTQGDIRLLNLVETGELVLYNHVKKVLVASKDRSLQAFKNRYKSGEWETVKIMAEDAVLEFNPNRHEQAWDDDYVGETISYKNILHLQRYPLPKWMLQTEQDDYPNELPQIYKDFLEHLVPDKDQRHIYFSWKKNGLLGTNASILIFTGLSSTGKSIEMLKAQFALMGEEVSRLAPNQFTSSRFNYVLKKSRFLGMDEVGAEGKTEMSALKGATNDKQMLNKKGVESETVHEINCNFMMTSNDLAYDVRPTERKFQFIEIAKVRLHSVFSKEKVGELVDRLENDLDFQAQIGWYFYNYETEITAHNDAIKGEKFWEVLFSSIQSSFPYAYHLYNQLKSMKKNETIKEETLAKQVSSMSDRYGKRKFFPQSILKWHGELVTENRAIFESYTEDGVKMIRTLVGSGGLDMEEATEEDNDFENL